METFEKALVNFNSGNCSSNTSTTRSVATATIIATTIDSTYTFTAENSIENNANETCGSTCNCDAELRELKRHYLSLIKDHLKILDKALANFNAGNTSSNTTPTASSSETATSLDSIINLLDTMMVENFNSGNFNLKN